jgi:hyperosmotically inducible protein
MKMSSVKWCLQIVLLSVLAVSSGWSTAASAQSQEATRRLQERITREVYHELVMLPELSIFDHLAFKVDGGNVTLLGEVRNAFLKDSAEKAVKHIEGVESIKNEIEVLPASINDDRIRQRVARAIFRDDRLFHYSLGSVPPIHIIVKGGHVTLKGAVNNQVDKDAAGLRANSVSGVFSVTNELEVTRSEGKKK